MLSKDKIARNNICTTCAHPGGGPMRKRCAFWAATTARFVPSFMNARLEEPVGIGLSPQGRLFYRLLQ